MAEVHCNDASDLQALETSLQELGFSTQELHGDTLEFSLDDLRFNLYWSVSEFRRELLTPSPDKLKATYDKDIALLSAEAEAFTHPRVFYESSTNEVFVDFVATQSYFFQNARCYVEWLQFLKAKEHKEDSFFHFVDHFSWDTRTFAFVSATKEGNVTVPFTNEVPNLSQTENCCERFRRFYDAFDDNDKKQKLPKFIKAETIATLGKEAKENRLLAFVSKLSQILDTAEQNFDIYLYDLSLENLKKEYLEAKDKYFAQLREILGKISAQIIALPISISAVALATYNIPKDAGNPQTVILLLVIAFAFYSSFAAFLLKLYREDINDMAFQYQNDFQRIEDSPFFIKYPNELEPFDAVRRRVSRKLATMRWTILVYFFVLTLTNSLLIAKLLNDISFNVGWSVFFAVVQLLLFFLIYEEIIKPRRKKQQS